MPVHLPYNGCELDAVDERLPAAKSSRWQLEEADTQRLA